MLRHRVGRRRIGRPRSPVNRPRHSPGTKPADPGWPAHAATRTHTPRPAGRSRIRSGDGSPHDHRPGHPDSGPGTDANPTRSGRGADLLGGSADGEPSRPRRLYDEPRPSFKSLRELPVPEPRRATAFRRSRAPDRNSRTMSGSGAVKIRSRACRRPVAERRRTLDTGDGAG